MTRFLFLPGMAGAGSFWRPVADLLEGEHRFVDWPGLGTAPADDRLGSFDDLTEWTIERLDGPSVLVAQSMGGVVAVNVALRRPDLVTHLVLCVTSGGVDVQAHGAADWRPSSRAAHPNAPGWYFDPVPDRTDALASIAVPTLLIWATADEISPLAVGQLLHRLVPHSELAVFASDDHWVAIDEAPAVASRIAALVCRA